jgi:hypothetical protein
MKPGPTQCPDTTFHTFYFRIAIINSWFSSTSGITKVFSPIPVHHLFVMTYRARHK